MFRLPGIPTVDVSQGDRASPVEIADFWEISCLRSPRKRASSEDIKLVLQRPAETDAESDDEADIRLEAIIEDAANEIRNRQEACGSGHHEYPFHFEGASLLLKESDRPDDESNRLYLFLLLATRLNMNADRNHGGHDGTLLFEEVCETCLGNVFGSRRLSLGFGASKIGGSFPTRMTRLCGSLGEGVQRKRNVSYQQNSGDDGLDLASWLPFSDRRRGKPIIFAQCKTGSSWTTADMRRLDPEAFCNLWMHPKPLLPPSRAFMAASRFDQDEWERSIYAGLFFDRCRIMDFSDGIPALLLVRMREWTNAAMQSQPFTMRSRSNRVRSRVRA